jgi:hypothetical protein
MPRACARCLRPGMSISAGLQDGGHARRVLARDGVSLSQDVSVNAAPKIWASRG